MKSPLIGAIRTAISIMLLRAGPQDVAYSPSLLLTVIIAFLATGMIALSTTVSEDVALASLVVDLVILLIYVNLILRALDKAARYLQTVTAMLAVGVCFHIIAIPLLMQTELVDGVQTITAGATLMMLLLLSWNILVTAHIFKHALESGPTNAILLSFALFMISFVVTQNLFPQP